MFQQGLICWQKCLVPLTAKVTESTTHCADSKQGIWGMAFKQWLSLKPFCLQMLWNWSRPELPLFCSPTSTSNASPSHCPGMCWLDLPCWLHSPLIGHWGPTWSRRSTTHYFLEDQALVKLENGVCPHWISFWRTPLSLLWDMSFG